MNDVVDDRGRHGTGADALTTNGALSTTLLASRLECMLVPLTPTSQCFSAGSGHDYHHFHAFPLLRDHSAQTPIFSVPPSSFSLSPMFYLMNSIIIINQTSLSTAKARAAFYYKQMAAKPTVCVTAVTQLIWILRRGSGCRH